MTPPQLVGSGICNCNYVSNLMAMAQLTQSLLSLESSLPQASNLLGGSSLGPGHSPSNALMGHRHVLQGPSWARVIPKHSSTAEQG
eukprot:scaffold275744_cov15-Tisochrysis_lutea.AAC.1